MDFKNCIKGYELTPEFATSGKTILLQVLKIMKNEDPAFMKLKCTYLFSNTAPSTSSINVSKEDAIYLYLDFRWGDKIKQYLNWNTHSTLLIMAVQHAVFVFDGKENIIKLLDSPNAPVNVALFDWRTRLMLSYGKNVSPIMIRASSLDTRSIPFDQAEQKTSYTPLCALTLGMSSCNIYGVVVFADPIKQTTNDPMLRIHVTDPSIQGKTPVCLSFFHSMENMPRMTISTGDIIRVNYLQVSQYKQDMQGTIRKSSWFSLYPKKPKFGQNPASPYFSFGNTNRTDGDLSILQTLRGVAPPSIQTKYIKTLEEICTECIPNQTKFVDCIAKILRVHAYSIFIWDGTGDSSNSSYIANEWERPKFGSVFQLHGGLSGSHNLINDANKKIGRWAHFRNFTVMGEHGDLGRNPSMRLVHTSKITYLNCNDDIVVNILQNIEYKSKQRGEAFGYKNHMHGMQMHTTQVSNQHNNNNSNIEEERQQITPAIVQQQNEQQNQLLYKQAKKARMNEPKKHHQEQTLVQQSSMQNMQWTPTMGTITQIQQQQMPPPPPPPPHEGQGIIKALKRKITDDIKYCCETSNDHQPVTLIKMMLAFPEDIYYFRLNVFIIDVKCHEIYSCKSCKALGNKELQLEHTCCSNCKTARISPTLFFQVLVADGTGSVVINVEERSLDVLFVNLPAHNRVKWIEDTIKQAKKYKLMMDCCVFSHVPVYVDTKYPKERVYTIFDTKWKTPNYK